MNELLAYLIEFQLNLFKLKFKYNLVVHYFNNTF